MNRANERPIVEACFGFRRRVFLQQVEEFLLFHHASFVHDILPVCAYNTLNFRNWFHLYRGFDVIGPAHGGAGT